MKCPYCGTQGETQVVDTSPELNGGIRRRRECRHCQQRFTTLERPVIATPMLIKGDGERQEFDRDKLIRGIKVACAKRKVSMEAITTLVDSIEVHLQRFGEDEVPSQIVGDLVIQGLKELDPIAYIRYAIVYLKLDDLNAVRAETDKLLYEANMRVSSLE